MENEEWQLLRFPHEHLLRTGLPQVQSPSSGSAGVLLVISVGGKLVLPTMTATMTQEPVGLTRPKEREEREVLERNGNLPLVSSFLPVVS